MSGRVRRKKGKSEEKEEAEGETGRRFRIEGRASRTRWSGCDAGAGAVQDSR